MFMDDKQPDNSYPDIQVCACANLRRATRLVTQAYDAALRPVGLRATQFTMLAVLGKRGQMRQSDFADVLGMDGTTLTRNLQPLLKKDWIRIDRDEDQRVRLISLTEPGRALLDTAVPLWREVQGQFQTGLGKTQMTALLSTLSATANVAQPG